MQLATANIKQDSRLATSTLTGSGAQPQGGLTAQGKLAMSQMWEYAKRESPLLEVITGTEGSLSKLSQGLNDIIASSKSGTEGKRYKPGEGVSTASGRLGEILPEFLPMGMTAWHGSPHKFAATKKNPLGEFDLSKMGSGEGAQAYGWGTYLAEGEGTAKFYRDALIENSGPAGDAVRLQKMYKDNALDVARENASKPNLTKEAREYSDEIVRVLESGDVPTGHLYEVDLPDSEIDKMLDWDKPFSNLPVEQQKLFDGFEGLGAQERNNIWDELELLATNDSKLYDKWYSADLGDATNRLVDGELTQADRQLINSTFREYKKDYDGKDILTALEDKHGKTVGDAYRSASSSGAKTNADFGVGQEQLSRKLNDAGIPGLKFLDQMSRGTGKGTRNFVVFDPKKAQIVGRNGEKAVKYPMAKEGEWWGEGTYKQAGGRLDNMTPDEFLANSKKLELDEVARENIDDIKKHIKDGGELDPLTLYDIDTKNVRASDGRHRAIAAKELGISEVPVVVYPDAIGKLK